MVRLALLAAGGGVAAIVVITALSAWPTIGNTAGIAVGTVGAIMTAAIGVAAAYLHRNRPRR